MLLVSSKDHPRLSFGNIIETMAGNCYPVITGTIHERPELALVPACFQTVAAFWNLILRPLQQRYFQLTPKR